MKSILQHNLLLIKEYHKTQKKATPKNPLMLIIIKITLLTIPLEMKSLKQDFWTIVIAI